MLISKIGNGFKVNNFKNNFSQKRFLLKPLGADSVTFSGKVQNEDKKAQLKEKTIYIFIGINTYDAILCRRIGRVA